MFSMVTTSTQGIASCFLLIPAAYLSGRLGYKKTIMRLYPLNFGGGAVGGGGFFGDGRDFIFAYPS
jgi:hypothetical protein